MSDECRNDVTAHDQRVHCRCPMLGGQAPFGHCRETAEGMPCARIIDCWHAIFDVTAFLETHYDMAELQARWAKPRKPKVLTLVDLIRQARGTADTDEATP